MKKITLFDRNFYISLLVVIIIIYGSLVAYVNSHPHSFMNPIVSFLVKEPKLKVNAGKLVFSIQGDVQRIAFRFRRDIVSASAITKDNTNIKHRRAYKLENSEDNHVLIIKNNNEVGDSLNGVIVSIVIREDIINSRQPAYIDEILINGSITSAADFFEKYIKIDNSNRNPILFYPLKLQNISNTLANTVGGFFVYSILTILLLLVAVQFFMLIIDIIVRAFNISIVNGHSHKIDEITHLYAIPLGLLGTIISIWYSLEVTNQRISDYSDLVEIIKIGIFTSVLGVSSMLMYELRHKVSK